MKHLGRWLVACALALATLPGYAAPLTYRGALELRSPVWSNRDFDPSFRYLDFAGHIKFSQAGSPFALWINGEHSFSRGYFVHENKMKVGLDFKVKNTPLTLFSYVERRFDGEDLDRAFVGARFGFHGDLD